MRSPMGEGALGAFLPSTLIVADLPGLPRPDGICFAVGVVAVLGGGTLLTGDVCVLMGWTPNGG
jgi:hypothetical protein